MPQMSPMLWFSLYIYILLLMMLFMVIIYYFVVYNLVLHKDNNKLNFLYYKFKW